MAITTNGQQNFTVLGQLVDGTLSPSYKWFGLGNNKLNGTYHPIDSSGNSQIGWWGTSASDASGNFATPPIISTDLINEIHTIIVSGDELLGEYPTAFRVDIINGGVNVYNITIAGNREIHKKFNLDKVYTGQIKITITAWSKPFQVVKLLETNEYPEVFRADVGSLSVTETTLTAPQISSTDSGTASGAEGKNLTVRINGTESSNITVVESSTETVTSIRTDSGTISVTETDAQTINESSTDTGTVGGADSSQAPNVYISPQESTTVSIAEVSSITNIITSPWDLAFASIIEMRTLSTLTGSSDSGSLSSADSATTTGTSQRPDAGTVAVVESRSITVTDTAQDSGSISEAPISSTIVVTLSAEIYNASIVETRQISTSTNTTDVGNISGGESSLSTVTTMSTDSCGVSVSESVRIDVSVVTQDNPTILETSTTSATISFSSMELYNASIIETRQMSISTSSGDSGSVSEIPSRSITVSLSSSDVGTVATAEVSNLTVNVPGLGDIGTSSATESSGIEATVPRTDATTVSLTDVSFMIQSEKYRSDGGTASVVETRSVRVTSIRTDTPTIGVVEKVTISVSLSSSDQGAVGETEFVLALALGAVDSAVIGVVEEVKMTNVHTAMDADIRRIHGRVEVTYTDPFLDESLRFNVSGSGNGTKPEYTADSISGASQQWFCLMDNCLDGSYYPIPANPLYNESIGWWSQQVADDVGNFPTPVVLETLFSARPIRDLKVVGDTIADIYPVDFTISLFNATDVLLYTENVVGSTNPRWAKHLDDQVNNVTKMRLTVTKGSQKGKQMRITEFYSTITETYGDEDVTFIGLLEEQEFQDNTTPFGNISSNELEVRLDNGDRKFDPMNTQSPLNKLLTKNRRIKAWLGVEITPTNIEWHPLGVYWTLNWNSPSMEIETSVIGRDRLELLRTTPFAMNVRANVSIYDLALTIFQDAGMQANEYSIDPALQNIVLPYAWFAPTNHRDALAFTAAAGLARCYCNRQGQVVMETYQPASNSTYTFSNDDSIIEVDHPVAWKQLVNDISVAYRTYTLSSSKEIYNSSEVIRVPAKSTIIEEIAFDSSDPVQYENHTITSGNTLTVTVLKAHSGGITLQITNNFSTYVDISSIVVTGKVLTAKGSKSVRAEDSQSIWENTRNTFAVDHPFIQSRTRAQEIANQLLAAGKDPRNNAVLKTRGNIGLRLGDRVTIPSYRSGDIMDYLIYRQTLTWDGSLEGEIEAQKIGG